jgi:hypothetical protein
MAWPQCNKNWNSPTRDNEWWLGLARRNGSEWPKCNKNWNSPMQGNKWWPGLAGCNGSEWLQCNKNQNSLIRATNCGQYWQGAMTVNGRSAIKVARIGWVRWQQMTAAR